MGRLGEAPFDAEVRAKADNEYPFSFLGNAIVCGAHESGDDVVGEALAPPIARGLLDLKP